MGVVSGLWLCGQWLLFMDLWLVWRLYVFAW